MSDKLPLAIGKRYHRIRDLFDDEDCALAEAYHIESKILASRLAKLVKDAGGLDADTWAPIYDALTVLESALDP